MSDQFTTYQPPGVYTTEERATAPAQVGVAPAVIGIVGPSIGFRTKSDAYDGRRRARIIKEADLLEISLVPFPMNESARVTGVKSLEDIKTIRDFEEALVNGTLPPLSAKEAKALLAEGFKAIRSERDAGAMSDDLAEIIRRNIASLTS